LGIWKARLRSQGIAVEDAATRFGEECIRFYDPSGLAIELVGANQDDRTPWASGDIEPDAAIRGLHSVTLSIRSLGPTVKLLRELLGFEIVDQGERRTRMGVHGGGPGKTVDLLESPDALPAVNGIGTVHHVAFAISSAEEQLRLREELLGRGYQVTEVRDRTYFQSIYFREPGGVLLEVATIQPGFTFDEELARLGEGLKLPPWEEPHRSQIEATLPDVK
jgi:glyoxalase family protein